MASEILQSGAGLSPHARLEGPGHRTAASYERELAEHKCTEAQLREALARDEARLCQKDELIRRQDVLSKESDHRLLNSLQLIASLLSLQSGSEANAGAAAQLAAAANRVATIARVHRRLHSLDGVQTVAFRQYLDDLCGDFSTMLSSRERPEHFPEHFIVVEGDEINLPTATGIPLACIVNELITNAVKHGKGRIAVRLEPTADKRHALSVSDDGPGLPEGFDPAACDGLGMRLISALVAQIGGELHIGRGDNGRGARFTVLFGGLVAPADA